MKGLTVFAEIILPIMVLVGLIASVAVGRWNITTIFVIIVTAFSIICGIVSLKGNK